MLLAARENPDVNDLRHDETWGLCVSPGGVSGIDGEVLKPSPVVVAAREGVSILVGLSGT